MNIEDTVRQMKKELLSKPMDNTTGVVINLLDFAQGIEDAILLESRTRERKIKEENDKFLKLLSESLIQYAESDNLTPVHTWEIADIVRDAIENPVRGTNRVKHWVENGFWDKDGQQNQVEFYRG